MSGEIEGPQDYKTRVREALDVLENYVGDDGKINATKMTQEIKQLRRENERLSVFAREIMKHWPDGDVGGGELQDIAIKCGLLVPEERTEFCEPPDQCRCSDYYGAEDSPFTFTCYRRIQL